MRFVKDLTLEKMRVKVDALGTMAPQPLRYFDRHRFQLPLKLQVERHADGLRPSSALSTI
jgi:hypothetical protein